MKRLLFCISDFRQGGIPRCLQSLLSVLDPKEYSVDVACLYQHGPYRGEMPNCRVLPADKIVERLMVHTKKITAKNFIANIPALATKIARSLMLKTAKKDLLESRLLKMADRISRENEYDAVIAYQEDYPAFLARHVKSKRRLLWIHNDYKWIPPGLESRRLTRFEEFDGICCVSHATAGSFKEALPDLSSRVSVMYNIVNFDYIHSMSQLPPRLDGDRGLYRIVSVGRVCWQKHFDLIPAVAAELKVRGLVFEWLVIGDGPERDMLNDLVSLNGVNDCVKLLGSVDNPYNIIASSDLYVLTSRYESYPTVINEAKALGLPIVSVDIPPAREMLDAEDVIVAEHDLADAIESFIHRGRGHRRVTGIGQEDNDEVIRKFSEILD